MRTLMAQPTGNTKVAVTGRSLRRETTELGGDQWPVRAKAQQALVLDVWPSTDSGHDQHADRVEPLLQVERQNQGGGATNLRSVLSS